MFANFYLFFIYYYNSEFQHNSRAIHKQQYYGKGNSKELIGYSILLVPFSKLSIENIDLRYAIIYIFVLSTSGITGISIVS